VLPFTF